MPPPGHPTGLEAVFLANRTRLIRFLAARGAGDAAEELVHELWLKISRRADGPIDNPLAYLFRAADTLMIDRYRARRQADIRDVAWSDGHRTGEASDEPLVERVITARQEAEQVSATLDALGPRKAAIFRRARIDGVPQKRIAAELGISLSTVESDLRSACRTLAELKERLR